MKQENFSCKSLQFCLVSPIIVFVPKAKTKNLQFFGEWRPDCLNIGAGKSSKLLNKSGFLNSLFSFSRWHVEDRSQCGSQAELKERFLMPSVSQHKPFTQHTKSPQFCFDLHFRSQELKILPGLIQTLKCYRFVLEKTPPPPSLLFGQKQTPQCFHDVKTCFVLFQPSLKKVKITLEEGRWCL